MIVQDAEIHRMQQAFRRLMDAFAHPGRVVEQPAAPSCDVASGLAAPLDTVVRLFVDQATTFHLSADAAAVRALADETRSKRAPVEQAAFCIVPASAGEEAAARTVRLACAGTPASPEKGATAILECGRLSDGPEPGLACFEVEGPGVKDTARFWADARLWAEARSVRGDEYPCGIEIVLVDAQGRMAAVPRSSTLRTVEGGR